jgi:hypothetical protein
MRVRFQASGGIGAFPGLAEPRTIDLDDLPADDRQSLEHLLQQAQFFDLPRKLPAAAGSADYLSYEITVEDATRQHTVTVSDPVAEPALRALITRLRALTRAPR